MKWLDKAHTAGKAFANKGGWQTRVFVILSFVISPIYISAVIWEDFGNDIIKFYKDAYRAFKRGSL